MSALNTYSYFPKKNTPNQNSSNTEKKPNIALDIFGRRFYADQTPTEYLSEFLLVFNSAKADENRNKFGENSFQVNDQTTHYCPSTRLALKFFSFFSQSKLETRHPVHQTEFLNAIEQLKNRMSHSISATEKNQLVQTLQSLLYGFVGVAKNRTWSTYNFLPITPMLLGREITWSHTTENFSDWEESTVKFSLSDHNFMARGGEVLFLQLGYLFSNITQNTDFIQKIASTDQYKHLEFNLESLQQQLENELNKLFRSETQSIEKICDFIEDALEDFDLPKAKLSHAKLATIPKSYVFEAFLFANELLSLLKSNISKLEKIELLQLLCVMQVLRSIMARSRQLDTTAHETKKFHGHYAWIACSPTAITSDPIRKYAENSYQKSEEIIYRILREEGKKHGVQESEYTNIDKHSFDVFKKMAKTIGLVIPITGGHQRFVLNANMIRLFVYTLIPAGKRIQMTEFLARIQTHFAISFFGEQLQDALQWQYEQPSDPTTDIKLNWFEESLKQSGLLIELSDSVSIVKNP